MKVMLSGAQLRHGMIVMHTHLSYPRNHRRGKNLQLGCLMPPVHALDACPLQALADPTYLLLLQASETLRGTVLGVYDAQECRFVLSDVQVRSCSTRRPTEQRHLPVQPSSRATCSGS